MRIPFDQEALSRMVARHVTAHHTTSVESARRIATVTPVARDDAAGLAIATRMQAQAASAAAASRNVQDGISLMQVADGALAAMTEYLDQIRIVALQAANGTFADSQRGALQIGVDSLLQGFDDTWRSISESPRSIQVGVDAGDTMTLPSGRVGERDWAVSVRNVESARSALDMLDEALRELYAERAAVGAAENRLGRILASLGAQESAGAAVAGRITDADLGREVVQLLRSRTWAQAGAQMLGEVQAAGRRALEILLASAVEPPTPVGGDALSGGAATGSASSPVAAASGVASAATVTIPAPQAPSVAGTRPGAPPVIIEAARSDVLDVPPVASVPAEQNPHV